VKSRHSRLVLAGLVLVLGGYTTYYAFLYDWRGSFQPDQLTLVAQVQGRALTLTMHNVGDRDVMAWEGPVPGGPFELSLQAQGETNRRTAAVVRTAAAGKSLPLKRGAQCSWRADLAELFPDAPPGRYTLRIAYDPAAAAGRRDPCAAELTLGRVEAEPVEVTLAAGK
jgi:hypothetical protein